MLWGLPDLTEKSCALSKGRAFRHAFTWLGGLPGSLKERCVGNRVNRILLCQTFLEQHSSLAEQQKPVPSLFSVNWEIHKLQEWRQQSYMESIETRSPGEACFFHCGPVEFHTRGLGFCSSSHSCPLTALWHYSPTSLSPPRDHKPLWRYNLYINSSHVSPTAFVQTLQVVGPQKIDGKTDFLADVICCKTNFTQC